MTISTTRALAREALKLATSRAPKIVKEDITEHLVDELNDTTANLMGKLTRLSAGEQDFDKNLDMASFIIFDALASEVINQLKSEMSARFRARYVK